VSRCLPGIGIASSIGALPPDWPFEDLMLARELVLNSLIELATDTAGRTPIEIGDMVMRVAMSVVDGDGVVLLAPRHRDCLRMLRGRTADHSEPEPAPRESSGFARRLARMASPFLTPDLAAEPRTSQDTFPGVDSGPAVFVPLGLRDKRPGYLATYRKRGAALFSREDVRVLTLVATCASLALENRRLAQDLQRLAVTDDLTHVYNYRYLKTALRREMKRAARFVQTLSLVMIDVDSLKSYNDVNGHLRGSFLLKELARLCAEQVRSFDVLAKYGGDEFTIILPQTEKEGALIVAERVRGAVARHVFPLTEPGAITVSLGVASFPEDAADPVSLLRAADRALYRAKRNGRNRVETNGERAACRRRVR
jgi:diguanylate cyclase (GGDEF)-like protein